MGTGRGRAGALLVTAVLPEPFASDDEETQGDVPLADLDQGATTSFPVEGYVVTKQWAALALDSYPVSNGPVGSADKIRLQRVVDAMQQFLGFPRFDIGSMLMPGG